MASGVVSSVASRLTTLSAQDMIKAMIAGERDPQKLAGLARGRMKAKHAALADALAGIFAGHHAELAQLLLDQIAFLDARMEIQSSRISARTGPSGEPILLLDQDRTRWDRLLINRGLAALTRAELLSMRGDTGGRPPGLAQSRGGSGGSSPQASTARGPYVLQAAIAACHARAFMAQETDWARITELYSVLAQVMPSPVVELNRAVAVAMAFGPQAGLDLVDKLTAEPALRGYHLLPSVRGDLLSKLGRADEAREEFLRASELTANL